MSDVIVNKLAEGGKIWNPGNKGIIPPRYAKIVEGVFLWVGVVSTLFYFLLAVTLRIFGNFIIHTTDQKALTITTDTSAQNIMSWLGTVASCALVFGLYLVVERKVPQRLPVRTISIAGSSQRFRKRTAFTFTYGFILFLMLPYVGGAIANVGSQEGEKVSAIQKWATKRTGLPITEKQAVSVYRASMAFPITGNYTNDLSRVETKSITVGEDTIKFSISHSSENIVVFKIDKNKSQLES